MYMYKPVAVRLIIIFTVCCCFVQVNGQQNILLYPDLGYRIENSLLRNPSFHASFKESFYTLKQQEELIDSLYGRNGQNLIKVQKGRTLTVANPVFQSSFRAGTRLLQHDAAGLRLASEISPKLKFNLNYTFHLLSNHAFPDSRLDTAGFVPHWGKAVSINRSWEYLNSVNGEITYTPNRFLSFQLGKDKHFWGDGYRSLFLSDNAPSFPYFATSLTIWKIKYTSFFGVMRDDTIGNYSRLLTKYASMHFLSWNATKRLNFNFFEAVVWRHRDDSLHRGLSINYLNPFLFYRPVEYNLGSPDNVLIGFGSHYLVGNSLLLYGQLMFDEFNYKDMVKANGWWANKYAYQVGIKWFDLFQVRDLYLQMEYNHTRPFTYGHSYPLQNYGSMLQPLAHPLGTNFREALLILRYAKGRWFLNTRFTVSQFGTEPGGKAMGGDIYLSSNHYAKTFGNEIGQGISHKMFEQEVTISRVLQPHWGLIAEAGVQNSFIMSPEKKQQLYITFGIKTLLYREEKLF